MPLLTKIEVNAEDIAAGEKKNCLRCPIALAIARVVAPGGVLVSVGGGSVTLTDGRTAGGAGCGLDLPESAQVFVQEFDEPPNRFPVPAPFSFHLPIPACFLRTP